MTTGHHHDHHHQAHEHGHGHGNEHDQGLSAMLRYAKHARSMWTSEINEAVAARLNVQPEDRVADIGAGVGAGVVVAAPLAKHVYAVEPTPYMRRLLRARMRLTRLRATVVDGAAEDTGIAPDSIDVVMAVNTMHHWTDMATAAHELKRILRPGGRVLLVDEDFENPDHPEFEKWSEVGSGEDGHSHQFHTVDVGHVAGLLSDAGLVVTTAASEMLAGRPSFVVAATASPGG